MKKTIGLMMVLALSPGLIAPAAWAEETKRLPVTTKSVQQKMKYFTNLVEKGAAAKLITSSGDAAAKQILEDVRRLVVEASVDVDAGQNVAADDKLNKALNMISSVARKLVGGDAKKKRLTNAFNLRKESVLVFLEAYERISKEKKIGSKAVANTRQVRAFLDSAEKKIASGNLQKAREELETAYSLITAYTADLRQGDTLVRELRFDTPKDEYLYEIDRNDSLFSVLDMTLKEKKPNPRFLSKINAFKQEAEDVRKTAEIQAGVGEFDKAMKTLSKANKVLIKAVRMGGLFIPG
ncbi:MAG: hypothetical protein JKY27_03900 [Magnetovibrio sp.]|nr:hypothetical protein [Magnetovibrio sp.]